MDKENEEYILNLLKTNNIWYGIGGVRYSGNDQYHNWYKIGYNENNVFGEIEFSKNPTWRVSYYLNGRYFHESGFLVSNPYKLLRILLQECIPRNEM